MTKIIALVPMRHHSQRVPGKNYRSLAGKPLFHHIIESLLQCTEIAEVVVDTDSEPVMDGLRQHFPTVRVLPRPAHLCADDVSMNEVLAFDTSQVETETVREHPGVQEPIFFLQTHSTNPLLRPQTISAAVQKFLSGYPTYDSMFSVTRIQTRLWDQLGRAINHNPAVLLQTQDLPPVYEENSCLYLFTHQILLARRNRLGDRPMMFEIPAAEAWDIDDELDFDIVNFMLNKHENL